jgi:hypothetical protein
LRRESAELQRRLMEERELPDGMATPPPASRAGQPLPPRVDMETLVIKYARAMAAGDLEQAERLAGDICSDIQAAEEIIQRLVADDLPPEQLAQIPRPVLVGFFKQLRDKGR